VFEQQAADGRTAEGASIRTELQMAMAFLRSESSKTVVRIDSVPGIRNAAPTPISPRTATSWPGVWQILERLLDGLDLWLKKRPSPSKETGP
jgi:hypothetical protein